MILNLDKTQLKDLGNKILIYGLIVYVFFILGRSVWVNWNLKKEIDSIKTQISQMQDQNKNLENLILYYQSDSFREVEARQKLGLKKPGETVITVPTNQYNNYQAETEAQQKRITAQNQNGNIPNYRLWWAYFFK